MSIYLGIDFGTSTNYVVRWNENKQCIEPQANLGQYKDSKLVDNVIYYGKENIVGYNALQRIVTDPLNTVRYIKREMDKSNWSVYIPYLDKNLDTESVCRDIFLYLKDKIESNHNEFIDGVVITVPFAFLHKERQRIKNAAKRAGIEVLALLEEPVAASIRYLDLKKDFLSNDPKTTMVFDLGGGTLDVTIFKIQKSNENYV